LGVLGWELGERMVEMRAANKTGRKGRESADQKIGLKVGRCAEDAG